MIPTIEWPSTRRDSPFDFNSQEKVLKLTLHIPAENEVSEEDRIAISVINELGWLPEIDVFETQENEFPYIDVNPKQNDDGYRNIRIISEGNIIQHSHGIHPSRIRETQIKHLIDYSRSDELFKSAEIDVIGAEAHFSLNRDIFVTTSSLLLEHREQFSYSNIRTPAEATRIIGLFLRSNNNWIYRYLKNSSIQTSKNYFYWILCRSKLPAMWKYFSGCVSAKDIFGDAIPNTGQSILERCSRSLQARDSIGIQFYKTQDNNTQAEIMYHFDYLTLLLSGAYDAQAVITNYVYSLEENQRSVSFRYENFRNALEDNNANDLFDLLTSNYCINLNIMLNKIRNTIHNAGLNTYASIGPATVTMSYIDVPNNIRELLWQSAISLETADSWGLIRENYSILDPETEELIPKVRISIEPFTYATKLTESWLSLINLIAKNTNISGLFPDDNQPELSDSPPKDWENLFSLFNVLA